MDWPDSQGYKESPTYFQSDANSEPNNKPNRYLRANGHASSYGHSNSHRYPPATATHGYANAGRRL
jgi:hypothetical protein